MQFFVIEILGGRMEAEVEVKVAHVKPKEEVEANVDCCCITGFWDGIGVKGSLFRGTNLT